MNADEIAEGFKRINGAAMKAVNESRYAEAVAIFMEGLALEEKLGLAVQVSESHANIGNVYFTAGEYDKALTHLTKALESFRKAGNIEGTVSISLTVAAILELSGDGAGAQRHLENALRAARTGEQRGRIHYRMACMYRQNGRNYQAQEAFGRALAEMERLNRQDDAMLCLLARAAFFIQTGSRTLALRDMARAKSISHNNDRLTRMFASAAAELGLDGIQ